MILELLCYQCNKMHWFTWCYLTVRKILQGFIWISICQLVFRLFSNCIVNKNWEFIIECNALQTRKRCFNSLQGLLKIKQLTFPRKVFQVQFYKLKRFPNRVPIEQYVLQQCSLEHQLRKNHKRSDVFKMIDFLTENKKKKIPYIWVIRKTDRKLLFNHAKNVFCFIKPKGSLNRWKMKIKLAEIIDISKN